MKQKKEETKVYTDLRKNVRIVDRNGANEEKELSLGDKVKQMYLNGIKKEAIASKLDVTLSEVDLILSIQMSRD